jgi:Flp pilus assembly pilin Flp
MAVFESAKHELQRLVADENGGSFIDYAIIITLVSIGVGFVMPEIGGFLGELFARSVSGLNAVATQVQ